MTQPGVILRSSRVDVALTGQPEGADFLYIFTGEVSCTFKSDSGTTFSDTLQITLPEATNLAAQDLVGFEAGMSPVPIILPTSSNANDAFSIIALNTPRLIITPSTAVGLILLANVAVQNGMLLNVQYSLSILVKKHKDR
jgi:hypothetical protein